jgi:hypothetical protein
LIPSTPFITTPTIEDFRIGSSTVWVHECLAHLGFNEVKIFARTFATFKAMPEQARKTGDVYASINAGDGVQDARPPERLSIAATPRVPSRMIM